MSSSIRGGSRENPFQGRVLGAALLHANQENVKAAEERTTKSRWCFWHCSDTRDPAHAFFFIYAIGTMWTWRDLAVQCELLPTWIESVSTRQENTEIIYCLWNSAPEIIGFFVFPSPKIKHSHIKTVMDDWFAVLWSYVLNKFKNVHTYLYFCACQCNNQHIKGKGDKRFVSLILIKGHTSCKGHMTSVFKA